MKHIHHRILGIFLCFLLALTGCGYKTLQEEFAQSEPRFTVVDDTLFPTDNASPLQGVITSMSWEEFKSWQQSLLRENSISARPLGKTSYDFETDGARKLRALANSPDLSQKLAHDASLDLFLCVAYERSPKLESARKKWLAVTHRYSQAEFLTNLMEQYTAFTKSLDLQSGMALQNPMISAKAPFPKSLALMSKVITSELEMAKVEYTMAVRELISQVTASYWDIIFYSHAVAIYEKQIQLFQSLETTVHDKYKSGIGNYSDILNIKTNKARTEVELGTYRQELENSKVQILTLLNLPVSWKLENLQELTCTNLAYELPEIHSLAQQNRLEILLVQLESRKLDEMIAMGRAELYPNFTPGLSYMENEANMDKPVFPEKPLTEPTFSFGQRNSYLAEMGLERDARKKEEENLKQETIAQVQEIHVFLSNSWRSLLISKDTVIPLAQENLKVTQSRYQTANETDFIDVLNAARMVLDAKLDFEKNKKDYGQKLTLLEKFTGQPMAQLIYKQDNKNF